MSHRRRLVPIVCALALLVSGVAVGWFAGPRTATAQVPVVDVKGKFNGYWSRSPYFTENTTVNVFSVPPGERLFITDITFANDGARTETARITRAVPGVPGFADGHDLVAAPGVTASVNLVSGIPFDQGDSVIVDVANFAGTPSKGRVSLRGYTLRIPTTARGFAKLPAVDVSFEDVPE